jgi:hypothetical protein
MPIFTDKPLGKLPRAKGHDQWQNEFKFGQLNMAVVVEDKFSALGLTQLMRKAIRNPGVRMVRYNEENGYEYETYAIFDLGTNTLTTNHFSCPRSYGHHVGSTCSMCGLKD